MIVINPLSPNNDLYQIPPSCNTNAYNFISTPEVMRIKDNYDHQREIFLIFLLITSPQYFYKKSMGTREENLFFNIRG